MSEIRVPSHEISFSESQIEEILERTEGVLRSGQVVLGRWTEEFEARYAERVGRRYGVAMSSDTAAFEALLRIIDVKGRWVLYPALGFPSLMQSVRNAGGEAWFIDASLEYGLFASAAMVEEELEKARGVNGRDRGAPRALILMHTGGLVASDSPEIEKLCWREGVVCFEDAAHAYGATLNARPAGTFGVASAFSLYATKPMHTMEGGIVVTDDQEIALRARTMRNYGQMTDFGRSIVVEHGYSWRMTEIQAIVGLANLQGIGENIARRREIMAAYDELIHFHDTFREHARPLEIAPGTDPNGYRYICLLAEGADETDRSRLKSVLKERHGIDLPGEVYELPTHKQPIWEQSYGMLHFPVAEDFCARHFALPVYPTLLDKIELEEIVNTVAETLIEIGAPTWTK